MNLIDLHVHTTASDGTFTPTEVVEEALQKKISVIAITDHDTTSGIREAIEALHHHECRDNSEEKYKNESEDNDKDREANKLIIVPGVEISCHYEGTEIHMLGLFINPDKEELENHLLVMREDRSSRNDRMIGLMNQDGIPVTKEKLQFGDPDTVVTRAHFARYLQEEGYVKTKDEAFKKYVGDGCPYYLQRNYINPETAIQWIHEAKGLAFLAHPYLYGMKEKQVRQMISDLKALGLDGLEAYHSTTDAGRTNMLREYAKKNELLVCGGSDFHGSNKPFIHLGVGKGNLRVTKHVYDKIVNREV